MRRIIPASNWHMALAEAIESSGEDDVIVVSDEYKLDLGKAAAERMGKSVTFEIEEADPLPIRLKDGAHDRPNDP